MQPVIEDYLDYRAFLKDQLAWLGQEDRKYSLRWVAKRAGFQSPSYLSMIVNGKRGLASERITALADALKLTHVQKEYFRNIVELAECRSVEDATKIEARIRMEFKEGLFVDIKESGAELFSNWFLPPLREAVTLKDFRPDPFWLSERIGITPSDAQDGFAKLVRIGMLTHANGRWERCDPSVKLKQTYEKLRIADYYTQSALQAIKAIPQSKDQRYFDGLTIAVSKSTFAKVCQILARVIREIDELGEQDVDRDQIIQLNMQCFTYGRSRSSNDR